MAESHDTEITLGTGKVLFLFFGLVALCAAFFGMGFKMGKNSSAPVVSSDATSATTVAGGARPSAVKPSTGAGSAASADLALYKSASQNSEDAPAMGSNPAGANASDSHFCSRPDRCPGGRRVLRASSGGEPPGRRRCSRRCPQEKAVRCFLGRRIRQALPRAGRAICRCQERGRHSRPAHERRLQSHS